MSSGARIGPYRILEPLGRGGMGVVYRAHHPGLDRPVALKLLSRGAAATAEQRRRFAREGEALARCRHPHIVSVHDAGEHEGTPYLVMDLAEGTSLQEALAQGGPRPAEDAARLGAALAGALASAHAAGVVHRDLKPENVLLTPRGPCLVDFGLAKDLDPSEATQALTQTGRFLGTPGFWSPEQAEGRAAHVGPASDLYSLGATLYAVLTGRPPFLAETLFEHAIATRERDPTPPRQLAPETPPALEAVILRCLRKDPGERYASAAELEADLLRFLAGEQVEAKATRSRWPRLALGALLGVAVLGGVGLALTRSKSGATPSPSASAPLAGPRAPRLLLRSPERPFVYGPLQVEVAVEDASCRVVLARPATPEDAAREVIAAGGAAAERLVPLTDAHVRAGESVALRLGASDLLGVRALRVLALDAEGRPWGGPLRLRPEVAEAWLRAPPAHLPPRLPPGVTPIAELPGVYRNEPDGSHLVWVPPGPAVAYAGSARVELREGVFLGRYEVSRRRYQEALSALTRAKPKPSKAAGEAADVSWLEAARYCAHAGARLPTELEFARAAWQDQPERAPWRRGRAPAVEDPIDTTPFGALNLCGNAREWLHLAGQSPEKGSVEAHPPDNHVARGPAQLGSYDDPPTPGSLRLVGSDCAFRIAVPLDGRTRIQLPPWRVLVRRIEGGGLGGYPRPPAASFLSREARRVEVRAIPPWLDAGWPVGFPPSGANHLELRTTLDVPAGRWAFVSATDDGVRIALREGEARRVLYERWTRHSTTTDVVAFDHPGGPLQVEVDYCNLGGGYELQLVLVPF